MHSYWLKSHVSYCTGWWNIQALIGIQGGKACEGPARRQDTLRGSCSNRKRLVFGDTRRFYNCSGIIRDWTPQSGIVMWGEEGRKTKNRLSWHSWTVMCYGRLTFGPFPAKTVRFVLLLLLPDRPHQAGVGLLESLGSRDLFVNVIGEVSQNADAVLHRLKWRTITEDFNQIYCTGTYSFLCVKAINLNLKYTHSYINKWSTYKENTYWI